jgi:3-deoxy-D-manno-octulosonic-acid transferase
MTYFFNLLYVVAGILLLPVLLWQRFVGGKRRAGWSPKLLGNVTVPNSNNRDNSNYIRGLTSPAQAGVNPSQRIWLHAVSVGEVNLLAPLVKLIEREQPGWQLYLTVGTVTGYELAQKKYPLLALSYAPLDFSWAVSRAIKRIQPDLVVLVELEVWPNLIAGVTQRGIPLAVINGRLSERSFRGYQRFGWLLGGTFRRLSLVAAQTEEYAERFRALGAKHVTVTGSLKFDNAPNDRTLPAIQRLREWAGWNGTETIFVAGSTGEPEEAFALEMYAALREEYPELRLAIVPRHPERFDEVARIIEARGFTCQRRSLPSLSPLAPSPLAPESSPPIPNPESPTPVILVDVIGELGHWWGTATIGFVGGSLNDRGGQNMIEPAAYGVATCFGPNTRNFRDIVALLLAADAAAVVPDGAGLTAFVKRCLEEPAWATALGERAAAFAKTQQGATARTLEKLHRVRSS